MSDLKLQEKKSSGVPESHRKNIVGYYEKTRKDYHWLWLNKENQAVHFGIFDESAEDHSDSLTNTNRVMARLASIGKNDVVLDAGCGQGGSSFWIAEHCGAKVKGITLVPFQVEMATRTAAERKLESLASFEVADYCATPFSDASFTVVWACESLCHADEKRKFYDEAYRLLKPGGRLVIAEYLRNERPLPKASERLIHEWLDGWSIQDIDTPGEHRSNMQAAGFTDIEIRNVTEQVRPSLRRLYRMSVWLLPVGWLLSRFNILNKGTWRNQFSSMRLYQALKNNAWQYTLITARKPDSHGNS